MAVSAVVEAFNLFDRANFSEVNNIFGRGAFPFEPQRDGQGRVTCGLFEHALPPRQVRYSRFASRSELGGTKVAARPTPQPNHETSPALAAL
jgi:hypothetical protein